MTGAARRALQPLKGLLLTNSVRLQTRHRCRQTAAKSRRIPMGSSQSTPQLQPAGATSWQPMSADTHVNVHSPIGVEDRLGQPAEPPPLQGCISQAIQQRTHLAAPATQQRGGWVAGRREAHRPQTLQDALWGRCMGGKVACMSLRTPVAPSNYGLQAIALAACLGKAAFTAAQRRQ